MALKEFNFLECPLSPFATGKIIQKIPYVFLPLKGQIINPSSEILLTRINSPICVISSAKFLTTSGWVELKNKTETESPFRLYRYENRNYLQWIGDPDLRLYMEGRLLLISMMCKDGSNQNNIILNPCVAFRVSGTPSETIRYPMGVNEVTFGTDALGGGGGAGGGMGSGYVAVALCSLALGLTYAAGVAWYLKRRSFKDGSPGPQADGTHPGGMEEGIVKNNPLLRHCTVQDSQQSAPYTSHHTATSSDEDDSSEIFHMHEDMPPSSSPTNMQVTSAMVHPRCDGHGCHGDGLDDPEATDASNIERHPEENLSIVETPEHRDERLGLVGSQPGRRKLYFNPAYFEHELLLAPPPAAIDFLTKIREVMSIAKAKMEAKRFLPSLLGIAEEREIDDGSVLDAVECASCRSNKLNKSQSSTMSCCHNGNDQNKVNSIRQWLENVPCAKSGYAGGSAVSCTGQQDYPSSVASSSRESSRNSYLSHASTIKESTKYAENVYSNCIDKDGSIVSNSKGSLKSVVDVNPKPFAAVNEDSSSEIDENIYMDQRYERFPLKSCRDEYMDYECITENTCKELGFGIAKSGFSTPTEYADIRPNIREKVSCSIVFNRNGNNEYLRVGSEPPIGGTADNKEDHDYEMIMVDSVDGTKSLPDFAHDNHSFISEIYVSNYADRFDRDNEYPMSDSSMNSIDSSNNSFLSNNNNDSKAKNNNSAVDNEQGLLTIKVEGQAVPKDDYESDNFEPDTLDRKPAKLTIHGAPPNPADFTVDFFTDSLERQPQIALKSTGSFRQSTLSLTSGNTASAVQKVRPNGVTLTKSFGSLREIFVAKNRHNQCNHRPTSAELGSTASLNHVSSISNIRWNKERSRTLKPDTRQAKRQRAPSPQTFSPPPVPPALDDDDHHEYKNIPMEADVPPPLPARKNRKATAPQPPTTLDQPLSGSKREKRHNSVIRNGNVRNSIRLFNKLPEAVGNDLRQLRSRHLISGPDSNSTTEYEFVTADSRDKRPQFFLRRSWSQENGTERSSAKKIYRQGHRTEDSGYLSTDSNNSEKGRREDHGSETDDSFFDGASESGAESIATDSFSFGKSLKHSTLPNHYSIHSDKTQDF
ncbi:Hypothetical protein NTJ_03756 [Nesidiocoris tenuis]|uniref:Uncharacterized protein n=1 Tax=Nesidiocoris tenuis TaxID=355587 RepID=A0ABN7AFX6_9HEMI|nr:Hypothetical protein NTJ_03756 [Nesidiocoris tenuis]